LKDFIDSTGQTWAVALDGLLLAELREAGIDIVQDGLHFIEAREDVLTKALLILCRDQRVGITPAITEKQFAQRLDGNTHEKAIVAVRGAAELFFRPSRWSEIQSRSAKRKEIEDQYDALRPMLSMLDQPDMPQQMRDAVMAAINDQIRAGMNSGSTEPTGNPSASGQDVTPSNVAGGSLASSA